MTKYSIGVPKYCNALPLVYGLGAACSILYGHPTEINRWLDERVIDIGLISSYHFLRNQSQLTSVSPFCIAAAQQVLSVLLHVKERVVAPKTIAVPHASATSVALVKILARKLWKWAPEYVIFNVDCANKQFLEEFDGYLLIGDMALQWVPGDGYVTYDLASAWFSLTQLPFVFALFASPDPTLCTEQFCQSLHSSFLQAQLQWDAMLTIAEANTRVPRALLEHYYSQLSYHKTDVHELSLQRFETCMREEL